GAAAEVVYCDELFVVLVEPVGQSGRGRLVDDAAYVEAGEASGFLGGRALGVVEVRRHGDDRAFDRLAEEGFGGSLELAQDVRGNFFGRVAFGADFDLRLALFSG